MVKDGLKNCGLPSFRAYMLVNIITFPSNFISQLMHLSSGSVKERSSLKEELLLKRIATPALALLQLLKRYF